MASDFETNACYVLTVLYYSDISCDSEIAVFKDENDAKAEMYQRVATEMMQEMRETPREIICTVELTHSTATVTVGDQETIYSIRKRAIQ